jgi:putative ABC transport system permease protein
MTAPTWRRYLRFWGRDVDADVDDELRFHVESAVADNVAAGMTPEQAREDALRRFGDVEGVRRRVRDIDRLTERERSRADMFDTFRQDLHFAARSLRRNPVFTLVAALTLALGVGANTAIFSVVNGVLLRPLPFREPDRLVNLFTAFHGSGDLRYSMSQPEFMDYKGLSNVFENAAAWRGSAQTLTGVGEPERVRGIFATRDLLPTLGVAPLRGRNFEGQEGRTGTEPVVILAHEFWQNRLGGDPSVLGRQLTLNAVSRRVIGILPSEVTLERAEAIMPLYINPDSMSGRSANFLQGVARLKPGVTVEQAQRELDALTRRTIVEYPENYPASMGYAANVVPMHEVLVGDVRPALLTLLAAVGMVLLIACANVANLLLARGEARQREIAVRLALGAGRGRVVRQLLTESLVLALIGAVGGALLAWWGTRTLLAVNPDAIPRLQEVRIDLTVGLVTLGLALVTGLVFGLAPALQMVRLELQSSLKEGGRGSESGSRQRIGRALVASEIALAVVVVIGAGLLMRSFWTLQRVEPGFDPERMLVVDMGIPSTRYDAEKSALFWRQLVDRMAALPGVKGATAANDMPPVAGGMNWDIIIDGMPNAPGQAAPSPNIRAVTREYFDLMGIRAASGRVFGAGDARGTQPVAVVNETAARAIWKGRDPVGQQVRFGSDMPWITVVGVAKDTRSAGLEAPVPTELFLVQDQMPQTAGGAERSMYVILRTAGDPASLAAAARRTVQEADPLLAITGIRTMDEIMARSLARQRFTMLLLGVFGAVALALAAIGIYGIMAYAVRRRTREIGIRMALGARPAQVLGLVVGQGMRLAAIGLAVGVAGAFVATRLMERLLYGVSATDPVTFAGIATLFAAVALVASWLPARRAVATNPTTALRAE